MGPIPFALSVHKFVSSVGADVGFASIIGLAILVLLYFAQARETASLRDRAEEAEQRTAALEQRVALLQRNQAATQQPPQAAAPGAAAPGTAAAPRPAAATAMGSAVASLKRTAERLVLPGAPAGVAAPALAAATKLIPTLPPAPAGATPAPVAAAGLSGSPEGNADDTVFVRPATAAAANGHGQAPAVVPQPVFAAGSEGGTAVASPPTEVAAPPARPATLPPRMQIRPEGSGGGGRPGGPSGAGAARSPLQPGRLVPPPRSPLARRLVPALIALGAVAVVVVALIVITSNSGTSHTAVHKSARTTAHGGGRHAAATPAPGTVTVAVLNGTAVTNLAHDVAQRLAVSGYKEGNIATAADQTHTTTLVGYLAGHRADAVAVAKALGLSASSIAPADSQATGVACPGTTPCAADVIVTVGTDLAAAAGGGTTTSGTP